MNQHDYTRMASPASVQLPSISTLLRSVDHDHVTGNPFSAAGPRPSLGPGPSPAQLPVVLPAWGSGAHAAPMHPGVRPPAHLHFPPAHVQRPPTPHSHLHSQSTPRATGDDLSGVPRSHALTPLAPHMLAPLLAPLAPLAPLTPPPALGRVSTSSSVPSSGSSSMSGPSSVHSCSEDVSAAHMHSHSRSHSTDAAAAAPLKCVCRNNTKTGHHIPRPRNAFILFRQHLHQQLFAKQSSYCENAEASFKTNSQISREIGQRWRELTDDDRRHWQDLAAKEKELHRKRYPDYKYIPRKSRAGKRQRKDGCEFCKRGGV
ncbi:Rox1p [Lachancea thermotolerans CBS 6340]|uniref:KLTH0F13926p n=1 Tax=Lachancea thermotolerans (strain ATCC 56472 / CBS 6340 / NRRL Y-8284) TaxID=559295 RepID=C5DJ67_LACTC|nr:KLTH0F13926p [Lachancea thermotolerans CBS 6340]CAR24356.1 KLTH0F13926p [Lachancea thermotolerans CBS 6340]